MNYDSSASTSADEIFSTNSKQPYKNHVNHHHDHDHSHDHSHHHHHSDTKSQDLVIKKLIKISVVCIIFMTVELIGGYIAHSLAIMSDAAHLLTDLTGFAISIIAVTLSKKGATKQYSFGYHRASVIGAFLNIILIWILTAWLLYEAIWRIIHIDEIEIEAGVMLATSIFGLVCNLAMAKVLHTPISKEFEGKCHHHHGGGGHDHHHHHHDSPVKTTKGKPIEEELPTMDKSSEPDSNSDECILAMEDISESEGESLEVQLPSSQDKKSLLNDHIDKEQENLNIRAAFIHIIGDIIQSVGVIVASFIILYGPENAKIADPLCTFLFSTIVLFTTIYITKDCFRIIMEGVPTSVKVDVVRDQLAQIEGVDEIKELNIWALNNEQIMLTAHITSSTPPQTLNRINEYTAQKKFKSTIQIMKDFDWEQNSSNGQSAK